MITVPVEATGEGKTHVVRLRNHSAVRCRDARLEVW